MPDHPYSDVILVGAATVRNDNPRHLNATNARYLATKARRGAHTLDLPFGERLDAEAQARDW
ncbi:hypothetical protein OG555_04495 [Kribbella sp. NBC_01484]|uniref:hypothetical protein n=1 Tax=Kribbella sp. NBC_01484 TaxID=2903579 RepID=UPI002E379277|nr:hypothetical protein [Kribbella sp. NBC_01484]